MPIFMDQILHLNTADWVYGSGRLGEMAWTFRAVSMCLPRRWLSFEI